MMRVVVVFSIAVLGSMSEEFDGRVYCPKKNHLIAALHDGDFVEVYIDENADVLLMCSFCGEEANREPKVWKFWNLLTDTKEEFEIEGRFSETALRSLVIRNVSSSDVGLYMCQMPYEDSPEDSFNYALDVFAYQGVNDSAHPKTFTNYTAWEGTVQPANTLFADMLFNLSTHELVKFQIVPAWSPWSDCEECTLNPVKRRSAFCRIIPLALDVDSSTNTTSLGFNSGSARRMTEILLEANVALACRGVLLKHFFPQFTGIVGSVGDLVEELGCQELCPVRGGKHGTLERRALNLHEGSRAHIPCSGRGHGDEFRWEHDKRRIESGELDGRVLVDHLGSLHLVDVSKSSRGNYTCIVSRDEKEIRAIEVQVHVTENFEQYWAVIKRHAIYLAIVCMLSFTSFAVLICGIYVRKKKFQRSLLVMEYELREPLLTSLDDDGESFSDFDESTDLTSTR